jgi:polyisoprenoid-binding protein YceI
MKKIIFSVAAIAAMSFKPSDTKNYVFDVKNSSIHWLGKKVTGQHDGGVNLKSGEITLAGEELKAAKFVVDLTSITVADLTDPGYNAKLVGHLKAEDFFGTDKFPEATFELKKASSPKKAESGNTYTVDGIFTIKGVSNEVSFPIVLVKSGNLVTAIGKINIDRTKYGIKYGSKSIFSDIGDKAIDDNFELDIKLSGKAK